MPDATTEVTHIAYVQTFGLVDDGSLTPPVECRAFGDYVSAVQWTRKMVEDGHGELAYVWPSIAKFHYDLGGQPSTNQREITWIMTPGGPMEGFVINTGMDAVDGEDG